MPDYSNPYFGSPSYQDLQRIADTEVEHARHTPGVVIHARVFTADDPATVGWPALHHRLVRGETISLRAVTRAVLDKAEAQFADLSPTVHSWNFHFGRAEDIADRCRAIAAGLPEGIEVRHPDAEDELEAAQAFMEAQGIAPFSKPALAGDLFPAWLTTLHDRATGDLVATGFAAMTHNHFSRWRNTAWVGLIAVAPNQRGKGLGRVVNALSIVAALDLPGADSVMEFVGPTNGTSARMVAGCGVLNDPDRHVVMLSCGGARLTR